jgi:hypothetical protein
VKVPLPAPGKSQVTELKVTVTAPKGKQVGSLSVRSTNDLVEKCSAMELVSQDGGTSATLQTLRSSKLQPSATEGVLDQIVSNICPGAEPYDSGGT